MKVTNGAIDLSEDDLKELFSLFSSSTQYEKQQIYDDRSQHYFLGVSLADEYSLTQDKREFALDAWRAVVHFLNTKGYSLCKDGQEVSLSFSDGQFMD